MRNLLKKPESVYDIIFETVTKNREAVQESAKKCKQLFKQKKDPADPNVLIELEKSLIGQEEYRDYYIKNFLPALLREVIQSEKLGLKKIEQVLRITSGIVKQSSEEECNSLLSNLEAKITESTKLSSEEKTERKKMIMELKISDDLSKIVDDLNPSVPSEKSPPSSPTSSRRSSVSTTLSSVGGDDEIPNSLNTPPEKIRKKYDEVMKELMEYKRKPELNRNEDQPPKRDPEEEQNTQENENNSEDTPPEKQPNNRNFRIALATGCALSVGCFIAGVVTLGMVGAVLFAMSVVFAIAAAVTRYLTPPSSELTSTDLSPLIDDGKQR